MTAAPTTDPDEAPASSFGRELNRLRREKKLSLAGLSALVHYSPGFLSRIENGKAHPRPELAKICDERLEANGALLALVDPPRRRRGAWTLPTPAVDLPATAEIFVGREAEIAALQRPLLSGNLRTSSVVVAYGMPGVGKTELVVRAASQLLDNFPDGCLYVELGGELRPLDAHKAMDEILRRLGVPADFISAQREERTSQYRRLMRERRVLLVLDNPARAADVQALVTPGGKGGVLVASRRRLDALDEAHHVPVEPLGPGDSERLLRQMLRGSGANDLSLSATAIARVMSACDGLPLAIRVAAAQLRAPGDDVADEFLERLARDKHGLAALDDGERSVLATFAVACAALPPAQSRLFGLLSLTGGRTFDHRVAGLLINESANAPLDGLTAACLVRRVAPRRYAFHDLIRAIAIRHCAAAMPDADVGVARDRLVEGYLLIAERAAVAVAPHRYEGARLQPGPATWYADLDGQAAATAWFEAEQENVVGMCQLALAADRPEACWRLSYAWRDHFFRTKQTELWIDSHLLALTAARQCGDRWAVAVTLNNLGLGFAIADRPDDADARYLEALDLFRGLDDQVGEANALGHLAWTAYHRCDHETAVERASAALRHYEAIGSARHVGITLRTLGLAEIALDRIDAAVRHLDRALAIFMRDGLGLDETMTLNCLGEAAWAQRSITAAMAFHQRAWLRAREHRSRSEQARAARGLADTARARGKQLAADLLAEQAERLRGATIS